MSRLLLRRLSPRLVPAACGQRPALQCLHLHSSARTPATALPITAHGPPPKPPLPAAEITDLHRRQKAARDLAAQSQPGKGRFWREVHITNTDDGLAITLDKRPIKTPTGKPLLIPSSKPLLAAAIALEWSLLRTSADALKGYLIPLTQLASRALDLDPPTHTEIVQNLLRYLDTDTLLCLAPAPTPLEHTPRVSLRELQEQAAAPVVAFLRANVWAGVTLVPVEGMGGVLPQPKETRDVVAAWAGALGRWDLVALERAVLASKSMCVAARLVVEWSEDMDLVGPRKRSFGVEEAARAASVEVRFQTGRWGEVEDTHDVEKEDLRRQLGASVLLAAGNGKGGAG